MVPWVRVLPPRLSESLETCLEKKERINPKG